MHSFMDYMETCTIISTPMEMVDFCLHQMLMETDQVTWIFSWKKNCHHNYFCFHFPSSAPIGLCSLSLLTPSGGPAVSSWFLSIGLCSLALTYYECFFLVLVCWIVLTNYFMFSRGPNVPSWLYSIGLSSWFLFTGGPTVYLLFLSVRLSS